MKKVLTLTAIALTGVLNNQAAVTWHYTGASAPADKMAAITAAMNAAVYNYNEYATYTADIAVTYNAGVPTAQTDGYQGLIEFGGSISARVAEHEMGHYFGCGTYSQWNAHRNTSNNTWTGSHAISQLAVFDGAGAVLHADTQHFWPYGWNQDNEGPADRNIAMVGALRQDMGLSNGTKPGIGVSPIANGTYKIINRNSQKALDVFNNQTVNGSKVDQWGYNGGNNQRWTVTQLGGGQYKIVGVQSGRALDVVSQSVADGALIDIWDYNSGENQKWILLPTSSGYYKVISAHSVKLLDVNGGSGADGASVIQWHDNGGNNQQWSFQAP